jgi:chemotaxis response regulator CheB
VKLLRGPEHRLGPQSSEVVCVLKPDQVETALLAIVTYISSRTIRKMPVRRIMAAVPKKTRSVKRRTPPTSIVGVGASAGGLEAFEQLLTFLPANTGMAFVLVQHLAPKHESMLSELLGRATKMPVIEVREGTPVRPDEVYVIPPDKAMSISKGILHLSGPCAAHADRFVPAVSR